MTPSTRSVDIFSSSGNRANSTLMTNAIGNGHVSSLTPLRTCGIVPPKPTKAGVRIESVTNLSVVDGNTLPSARTIILETRTATLKAKAIMPMWRHQLRRLHTVLPLLSRVFSREGYELFPHVTSFILTSMRLQATVRNARPSLTPQTIRKGL